MKAHQLTYLFLLIAVTSIAQKMPPIKKNINTTEFTTIGGIKQCINIKSADTTKPVLLYLHGGPGESVMTIADTFTTKLQQEFVVVQWDQRGSGKTAEANASGAPFSLTTMKMDTYELTQYLLKRFKQKKLYLVGHSFGTVLGFYMADKYPQLLNAYIAISPTINTMESEELNLQKIKSKAKETNNEQALQELATVKIPYENWEQMFFCYKWMWMFDGKLSKPGDVEELKAFAKEWSAKWLGIYNDVERQNLLKTLPIINCPVYFFVGRTDFQTNFAVTEKYYNSLKAPKKKLYWFEKSAHNVPFSEPDLMQEIIVKQVLQETH